jgi:hypothetical protein
MSTTILTEETALVPLGAEELGVEPGVSWGAIVAGAVAAAGFSLFLIEFGVGVGLSVVSPWAGSGPSATTMGWSAGICLVLISVMASALGGFVTGRLRRSWLAMEGDEAYLRDSAHGLVTWALATIIGASLLAAAATSLLGGAVQGATANPSLAPNTAYYTDMLFRSTAATPPTAPANQTNNEDVSRILGQALVRGASLSSDDRAYVAQRVAARTGLSQDEAERRVDAVITRAKAAADETRKAAAKLALWMAAALLAGALSAAFAAAEGGRERDGR